MSSWLHRTCGGLLAAALMLGLPLPPLAAMWQAGTGFFVSSGDYGQDSDTTVTYIPFLFGRVWDRGKLDLVIPFLSVSSKDNITIIGGGARPTGRARVEEMRESGLGDMLLRARWEALEEQGALPATELTSRIKLPTADEDKGLGTGEFDAGVGVEFSKTIQGPWSALADLGYTWTGNPPGQTLRDPWNFGLGAGYQFQERLFGTATYEESRALVAGTDNPRDLTFSLAYQPKPTLDLGGHLGFGLSDGSPDILFGINASLKFDHF